MKTKKRKSISLVLLICLLLSSFSNVFAFEDQERPKTLIKQEEKIDEGLTPPVHPSKEEDKPLKKEKKEENKPNKTMEDQSGKQDVEEEEGKDQDSKENTLDQDQKGKPLEPRVEEEKQVDEKAQEEKEEIEEVVPEEDKTDQGVRRSLTKKDQDLIDKYKEVLRRESIPQQEAEDVEAFIEGIKALKDGEKTLDPKVTLRPLDLKKGYLEVNLTYKEPRDFNQIHLKLSKNADLVKAVYREQDLKELDQILKDIDNRLNEKPRKEKKDKGPKSQGFFDQIFSRKPLGPKAMFPKENLGLESIFNLEGKNLDKIDKTKKIKDLKTLISKLESIQPTYSLEEEGLFLVKEKVSHDFSYKDLTLKSRKGPTKDLRLVFKLKEGALEDTDFLSLSLDYEGGEDQISFVKKMDFMPLALRARSNTSPVQSTQTINGEDIAPPNYLKLLSNMPGARATVSPGPGVHRSHKGRDIVTLPAGTEKNRGALWGGDWDNSASKSVFTQLGETDATAVRFNPSKPGGFWDRTYRNNMDAGWDTGDLNLSTTSMYVTVDYTNAAYYKNDIVDAKATIKVTPMKNRTEGSYSSGDYGNYQYYPMLQISHNLYKGWCWQNVREINIDLTFYKKDGTKIQFESGTFGSDKATYFTINSLNPTGEHTDGAIHNLGPEYVRPLEGTYTGAYVIPGSNIVTSYGSGQNVGTQYAYNGGTRPWDDDSPEKPGWSKNSVLFTTGHTDHLNFTMGNLMRDPAPGYVPRTNFVWTSMSTQSFTNHYVLYKDIEVEKNWSDGGAGQGPITVNLLKNYKVKVSYGQGWWGRQTREIEVKNLLAQSIQLSSQEDWKGGFYQVPDEESQKKLLMRTYKKDKNQLKVDAKDQFPQDIPEEFTIESIEDFSYSISEVTVHGYESHIEKTTYIGKDTYEITNTKTGGDPEPPQPLKPKVKIHKTIDYLGDGKKNPDTRIQTDSTFKENLPNIYRLYLDVEGERLRKEEPTDLLFVLDGSSSMNKRDMKNTWGQEVSRKEAMEDMLNNSDLIPSFLKQNKDNRVAFLYFNGDTRNRQTRRDQGYTYTKDSHLIQGWTKNFSKNISLDIPRNRMGTNYQAGLMGAEDLLKDQVSRGRRRAMVFISDGVPTYYIDSNGNRIGNGRYNDDHTVRSSMEGTKSYLDGFSRRFPNVTIHAVGVSRDIHETSSSGSQSPEVLKYMARLGQGEFISVKDDTRELVKKLRHAIEASVGKVTIEDSLSSYVDPLEGGEDLKVVKKNTITKEETVLYENKSFTPDNGNRSIIDSVSYDSGTKKYVLRFNPDYKLEENIRYIISYNIKTTQKAMDDYRIGGYTSKGDLGTDYPGNQTSSLKDGFRSNREAKLYYNDTNKTYPHPVVQVKEQPGFELPPTGGHGLAFMKNLGALCSLGAGIFLAKKREDF